MPSVVKGHALGAVSPPLAVGGAGAVLTGIQDYFSQICSFRSFEIQRSIMNIWNTPIVKSAMAGSIKILPGWSVAPLPLQFAAFLLLFEPPFPGSSGGAGGLSVLRFSLRPLNQPDEFPQHSLTVHVLGSVDPGPEDQNTLTAEAVSRKPDQSAAYIIGKGF